jgi:hypothetical protein
MAVKKRYIEFVDPAAIAISCATCKFPFAIPADIRRFRLPDTCPNCEAPWTPPRPELPQRPHIARVINLPQFPEDQEFSRFVVAMQHIMKVPSSEIEKRHQQWEQSRYSTQSPAPRITRRRQLVKALDPRKTLRKAIGKGKKLFGMDFFMVDPSSRVAPFKIENKRDIKVFVQLASRIIPWEPSLDSGSHKPSETIRLPGQPGI